MATAEDVARGTVASLGSDVSWQLVIQWVDARYKNICRRVRMRHLRQVAELVLPAAVSAGTLSVTQGSQTVTGDATAKAAWSNAMRGRHLRVLNDWYEIAEVNQVTKVITLHTSYIGATGTGLSYAIIQRFAPLPVNTRHFSSFVHGTRRVPIRIISYEELNMYAPDRPSVGQYPRVACEIGSVLNIQGEQVRLVEFYPYDNEDALVRYLRWPDPPDLAFDSGLPIGMDEDVLREGALIDLMRYDMARLVREGKIEAAALMRNEYRAQMTSWEAMVRQTIREDKGDDDMLTFTQEAGIPLASASITNAHDFVWSRY